MKLRSYQEMLTEYEISDLASDDNINRRAMFSLYPYSVILEGEFSEIDNLNKWISLNIRIKDPNYLIYGKTGYDYGFAEYFFAGQTQAEQVAKVIPHIYTVYPKSLFPNKAIRSNGYQEIISYDPNDPNGVVLT